MGFNIIPEENPGFIMLEPALQESSQIIKYQVEMITANNIPGLLRTTVHRMNDQIRISYDICDYTPLDIFLENNGITGDEIVIFMSRLKSIFRESKKYLLSLESFVLIDCYVYVKDGLKDIALLYVPARTDQDVDSAFKDLLLNMIAYLKDDPGTEMAGFISELKEGDVRINLLDKYIRRFFDIEKPYSPLMGTVQVLTDSLQEKNLTEISALAAKKEEWQHRVSRLNQTVHPDNGVEPKDQPNTRLYIMVIIAAAVMTLAVFSAMEDQFKNLPAVNLIAGVFLVSGSAGSVLYIYKKTRQGHREETVENLNNAAGTTGDGTDIPKAFSLLKGAFVPLIYKNSEESLQKKKREAVMPGSNQSCFSKDVPFLKIVREGKEEKIWVNKPEFFIGRSNAVVDYCIDNDENISRIHIKITGREEQYHIVNLGPHNNTFVNDIRLNRNRLYQLKLKDKIRISSMEFIFDKD
ncbi:MAG: DUF6382 domain-containing protein [Bacillota bacterium]